VNRRLIAKAGIFRSETVLAWARRRVCAGCSAPAPSDPHHYPPCGLGGGHRDDTKVIPLCRECHDKAQRYVPQFTHHWQELHAALTFVEFARTATAAEWAAFTDERRSWISSRVFIEAIPA
jgi:hypothetical protein